MGKLKNDNQLRAQRTARPLLAMTLAASLAAFGCTTNHNLGNGSPTRSGPDVRTAPTAGVTSGGETTTPPSNTSVYTPMTSSYTESAVLPPVQARTSTVKATSAKGTSRVIRRSPDEAAAIMAGRQPLRGRYLGVVSPGNSGRGYASSNIQTYVNPAMQTNPQLTVNSSISSDPNAVISSGADGLFDAGGGVVTGGTTAAATVGATTTAGTTVTPTTAGTGLAVGTFAGLTPSPTLASSGVPSVTAASVGLGRSAAQRAAAANATTTTTTTTTATTDAATVAGTVVGTRAGAVASPVRVMRSTTGNVTVTNVGTTPVTTGSGRSQ